uniref:hypothetical protein n=1 Tax=Vibrio cholerae TaxID=666 RepID=UPI003F58B00A
MKSQSNLGVMIGSLLSMKIFIYDVVKTDAQLGKESQAEVNGWLIKYKAISDLEVECSVKKL